MIPIRDIIDEAIVNEEPLRFYYLKAIGDMPQQRVVSPYEVAGDGETFLGFDHRREALRRFDFSKVIDIEPATNEQYVYPVEKEDV